MRQRIIFMIIIIIIIIIIINVMLQIALAPLLEWTPQCGIEEEDGSAEAAEEYE